MITKEKGPHQNHPNNNITITFYAIYEIHFTFYPYNHDCYLVIMVSHAPNSRKTLPLFSFYNKQKKNDILLPNIN